MLTYWIYRLRLIAADVLLWSGVAAAAAAAVVAGYLAGPWAAVGAGVAGNAFLYWVIWPLTRRLNGTRRRARRSGGLRSSGCRDCVRGCPARSGRGRCECTCPTSCASRRIPAATPR